MGRDAGTGDSFPYGLLGIISFERVSASGFILAGHTKVYIFSSMRYLHTGILQQLQKIFKGGRVFLESGVNGLPDLILK